MTVGLNIEYHVLFRFVQKAGSLGFVSSLVIVKWSRFELLGFRPNEFRRVEYSANICEEALSRRVGRNEIGLRRHLR